MNFFSIQKKDFRNGYTLIEILAAMSIAALIFAIGYVNFRDFSRRQALAGYARNLKGDLRLAQQEALTGKKPTDALDKCVDDTDVTRPTLSGYNFRVVSTSIYTIEAVCSGGTIEIKRVVLGTDMTLGAPNPNPILFKILGQGTNITTASPASITLTQTGTANVATIIVTASGEIK